MKTQMHQPAGDEEYRARSLAYLAQFGQGAFGPFLQALAEDYSGPVPKGSFAAQMEQVLRAFGPQQALLGCDVAREGAGTAVEVTSLHILRKLCFTFLYNERGDIARFDLKPAPLDVEPRSTDAWEEHPIRVGATGKKLNGMLTLPRGVERPPVVVLQQGSGPSNMNEQVGLGGNMPFADLAHGLAERGVASIRYDKRSYTYPEDMVYADVNDEYLDDAADAVRLAAEDGRVDANRLFLLGHSEGGMVGPEIARRNPRICGFISLAGTPRRLEDILLEQTRKMLDGAAGLSKEQRRGQLAAVEQAVRQIKALEEHGQNSLILGASADYWRSLNAIDTPALARQLAIPMLIMQGGEDFQVLAAVDYKLWQEILAGREDVAFRLYPQLNHLFMRGGCKDRIDPTVYDKPAHMEAEVVRDIADWIKACRPKGAD